MSWVDGAIEAASNPIDVDVSDLGLEVKTLQVLPLSANEYNTLKLDPHITKMGAGQDRLEMLGMLTVFTMLNKCDKSLSWKKFMSIPLTLLSEIAQRCTDAVGSTTGGGALGE